ncbi:MAG: tRNA threonylcarbamoyladenosine dehydratase, partial [Muribaculaceae bacterium]|nr:tRNA threonylcarbamoyladenosine dehydratase [Muribaculaceae bacterium]
LIRMATAAPRPTTLFSSMGAARKLDPLQMRVSEFWQVKGCPLAAALRQRFKRSGLYPARKFKAVWSPEVRQNLMADAESNGSLVHITAIWGMTLASLVINNIINPNNNR